MIQTIAQTLYANEPTGTLYHYTTIHGLQGIIQSRYLWASDVRYMNDAAELNHLVKLLKECSESFPNQKESLKKFIHWISHRITNGHLVFAVSFRSNGNLLSQWRGYSEIGKGVSLGFSAETLLSLATRNHFKLGRCIYDIEAQKRIIYQLLSDLTKSLKDIDGEVEALFQEVETDVLQIAALLKHPSFIEEDEWRLVSQMVTDYQSAPVGFREGKSMLIPYYEFPIAKGDCPIPLQHVYVGPTPNIQLSLNSMRMYLQKNGVVLKDDVSYCDIPYRSR